jgi:hypothetical protein
MLRAGSILACSMDDMEFEMHDLNKRRFFALASSLAAAPVLAQTVRPTAAPPRRAAGTIRLKDQTELFVKDWGRGRPASTKGPAHAKRRRGLQV